MRRWSRTFAESVALVAAVTGVAHVLEGHLGIANIALLYLLPVMAQSGRAGLKAGLATSTLAALAFNFFLVPPRYTLHIANPDNLVTLLVLFAVALAVSELASRLRTQAGRAERLARINARLATYSEELAGARDESEALEKLRAALEEMLGVHMLHMDADCDPLPEDISGLDMAAARWAVDNGVRTGRGTSIMGGAEWMFTPLATAGCARRVLAIVRDDAGPVLHGEDDHLLDALIERTRQALSRIALAREARIHEGNRQREQLREALLASIGHDLRTPLTAIRGGLATLTVAADQDETLADVRSGVSRLERLVTNMLEMTRIEAGALSPRLDIIDVTDAVASVMESLSPAVASAIILSLPTDLPMMRADPYMLHHMLLNLVENAVRHGNGMRGMEIRAMQTTEGASIDVADHGPGIDTDLADIIFDRFERGGSGAGGSGLGLAIVRGFGDAMGVAIQAANRAEGTGAIFSIKFPANLLVPSQ